MLHHLPRHAASLILIALLSPLSAAEPGLPPGQLFGRSPDGAELPATLTAMRYEVVIRGIVARVELVQTWRNPHDVALETVYTYPLPHRAAVDTLILEVGGRRIQGISLERAAAQAVYDKALTEGRTASLLTQERPNIFTQHLGNLAPGAEVEIRVGFTDVLPRVDGEYRFHLPMTVGPRYLPGTPLLTRSGDGSGPDTDQVPDGSRITPPLDAQSPLRVTLDLELDPGLAMAGLRSLNQAITSRKRAGNAHHVAFADGAVVPNADLDLRFRLRGAAPQVALHATPATGDAPGVLLLQLEPGELATDLNQRQPRDVCFLVDISGSMNGPPIEQAKAAMRAFAKRCGPEDRVRVIAFAGAAEDITAGWQPATPAVLEAALADLNRRQGRGGTEMLSAFQAAVADPVPAGRVRATVLLSDGYIGNEAAVHQRVAAASSASSRFWALGIGSSVNRHLIEGIGQFGGGAGEVLALGQDPHEAVGSLWRRLTAPQLSGITVTWDGAEVTEPTPVQLPDLHAGEPLLLLSRYRGEGTVSVTVSGLVDGQPRHYRTEAWLPAYDEGEDGLLALWARRRIDELIAVALRGGNQNSAREAVISLACAHNLTSPWTSLVAVDREAISVDPTTRRRIVLPSALPAGINPIFARGSEEAVTAAELGGGGAFTAIGVGGGAAGAFGSRSGGGRRRAIGLHGGSRGSESAVEAGLRALTQQQPASIVGRALALLAYQGAGYDHKTPNRWRQQVNGQIQSLVALQAADGAFDADLVTQSLATAALAEAYAMTNDPVLREPVQRAVDHLLARSHTADGQRWWSDHATMPQRGSTRLALFATLALKSVQAGGLNDHGAMTEVRAWATAARAAGDGLSLPSWYEAGGAAASDTDDARSLMLLVFLGSGADEVKALAERLVATRLNGDQRRLSEDPEIDWATTEGLYQAGGDPWQRWNGWHRDAVIASQTAGGDADGTWPVAIAGPWSDLSSSTALRVRSLQIYYTYWRPAGGP